MQAMMSFQEKAQKKIDAQKRSKKEWEESWDLSFVQTTTGKMMKKGLCFKCSARGHRANECKTKDLTSAADGMQAVQIKDQEHVFSWMTN